MPVGPVDNLPVPRFQLIGRERELRKVRQLVTRGEERLVTLTGVGGCGKTSLALRVAADVRGSFPDGVCLVELETVSDETLVPLVIATTAGAQLTAGDDPIRALVAHLQVRTLLLVLDNCEQVVDVCANLCERLLSTCSNLRILATSREPLQILGEKRWRVPPLAVPDVDRPASLDEIALCPSVQLFIGRARAVEPDFRLTPENAVTVAQICAHLEGIPLAIELAAARARVLGVDQIRQMLGDALRLLVGGDRAGPIRHQTLRAALEWSYNLLSQREQAAFRRLAILPDGFDLTSAEVVCSTGVAEAADVLDLLTSLVDKSLVLVGNRHGQAWYRLRGVVRQYGLQQLTLAGEAESIYDRHLSYVVALAELAEPQVWGAGGDQGAWLDRLEAEQESFRAAMAWGLTRDVESAARIAGSLWHYGRLRGHVVECQHWLEEVITRSVRPSLAVGKSMLGAAFLAREQGDFALAQSRSERSLALFREIGDRWGVGMALLSLACQSLWKSETQTAQTTLEECLVHFQAVQFQWGIGSALCHLGLLAQARGLPEQARAFFDDALECHLGISDRWGAAVTMESAGQLAWLQCDSAEAPMRLEACLSALKGCEFEGAVGARLAGLLALSTCDYTRARLIAQRSIGQLHQAGLNRHLPEHLLILGMALVGEGDLVAGVRLAGASTALMEVYGYTLGDRWYEASLINARGSLGQRAYQQIWAEGCGMVLDQAADYALSVVEGDPPTTRTSPTVPTKSAHHLTRREQEVAALLGRGLTDRMISQELTLTEGTVGIHVHHILGKLDFHSRWQIADWLKAAYPAGPTPDSTSKLSVTLRRSA